MARSELYSYFENKYNLLLRQFRNKTILSIAELLVFQDRISLEPVLALTL